MKTKTIVFIAILTLVSFGTAHSAHAFVEPISTITFICGGVAFGFAALVDTVFHKPEESAQVQDQQGAQTKKQALEEQNKANETQKNIGQSTGN